jgi:hypothetical protein
LERDFCRRRQTPRKRPEDDISERRPEFGDYRARNGRKNGGRLDKIASSLILITMQRLHVDDLSGILIDQGWPSLVLPAIATETVEYELGEGEIYRRHTGELLPPDRDTSEGMEVQRASMGSKIFSAQYQQNPVPPDGNMIKSDWLRRYDFVPGERWFGRVVLSCDPAGKAGQHNDYTSIAIFGFNDKHVEAGLVLLPKEAPWLADLEAELLAFPSGRYDDQVDALLLFLDWFAQADRLPTYGVGLPIYGGDDCSY